MKPQLYFYLLAAVGLGTILGWMLRGSGSADGNGEIGSSRSADHSGTWNLSDRARLHNGAGDRGTRRSDQEEAEDVIRVSPEQVAALLDSKVKPLEHRIELIDPDEPLARFIDLNQQEAEILNHYWEQLKPKLDDVRMKNVKHQRLPDGGVWLGIEPFPSEGDQFRQEFMLKVHSLLDESRGKVFLDAIRAHDAYGKWGTTVGTGFAIRILEQADESLVYEIIEQSTADGRPGKKWLAPKVPVHLEEMAEVVGVPLKP